VENFVDIDLDPDSTYHLDGDTDPDPDPNPSFTHLLEIRTKYSSALHLVEMDTDSDSAK
jgi:hypothetical protein